MTGRLAEAEIIIVEVAVRKVVSEVIVFVVV